MKRKPSKDEGNNLDELINLSIGADAFAQLVASHRKLCRSELGPLLGHFVHGMTVFAIHQKAWEAIQEEKPDITSEQEDLNS